MTMTKKNTSPPECEGLYHAALTSLDAIGEERDRLKAENERLQAALSSAIVEGSKRIESLRAENERLRADYIMAKDACQIEWIKTEDIEEDGWYWFSGVYAEGCAPIFELLRLFHSDGHYPDRMNIENVGGEGCQAWIDDKHWTGYWLPVNIEEPEPSVHDVKMRRHMGYEENRCGAAFCDYECKNHEQEGGER